MLKMVWCFCGVLLSFISFSAAATPSTSPNYTLTHATLSAGGKVYGSANYTHPFAVGQALPSVEFPASLNYRLASDFYAGVAGYQPPIGEIQFSQANYHGNENAGSVTITVSRVNGAAGAIAVDWQTADNTAIAGSDYIAATGILNWADGDTADKTFTVTLTADVATEGNELVNLSLTNPTNGASLGSQNTATLTIIDVVPAGTVQFTQVTQTLAENSASVTLNIERVNGDNGAISVNFATSDGTATAGSDYTANSNILNWADGDSAAKTITVTLTDDTTYEGDETFTVKLSAPAGGANLGANHTVTVTLQENDQPGTLRLIAASDTIAENGGNLTVVVERIGGSDGAVSVQYATATGTAGTGDFTATSGTLHWADGISANQSFTVMITNDATFEANETFNITLFNPTGGAVLGSPAISAITIQNDDPQPPPPPPAPRPGTLQWATNAYAVDEGAGEVVVQLTRVNGSDGGVTVELITADATAQAGSDYTPQNLILTFAPGEITKTLAIPVIDDGVNETAETFTVTVRNPAGGAVLGSLQTTTVTIGDNDPHSIAGTLQFRAATVLAGEGDGAVALTLERINGSLGAVTVELATTDGTAQAGSDYTAVQQTVTFAHGETVKTLSIPILDDVNNEGTLNESFTVALANPTNGAALGASQQATVSIRDDDHCPAGVIQWTTAQQTVAENTGQALVTASRAQGTCGAVTVNYATAEGSARANDFTATSGTLSWLDGQADPQSVNIPITNDSQYEGTTPEILTVNLSNPTNGAVLSAPITQQIHITDDDPQSTSGGIVIPPSPSPTQVPGVITLAQGEYTVHEGQTLTISATRKDGQKGAITLAYEVIPVSASADTDYQLPSGSLAWADGESGAQTLTLTTVDDDRFEAPEQLVVVLQAPTGGAELGEIQSAILTIEDDDQDKLMDAVYCIQGGCGYTLQPSALSHGMEAEGGLVRVLASGPQCVWQAESPVPWLQLQTSNQEQGDAVTYFIARNESGDSRSAELTLACATVTVEQAAETHKPKKQPCAELDQQGSVNQQQCGAKFEITASRDGGLTFGNTFSVHDRVEVYANITLPPHHVSQVGEWVALVLHDGKPWRKAPHLWVPADPDNIPGMTAFSDPKILAESEVFQVVDGVIGVPGRFEVFVGYRMGDGIVIFNPAAFRMTVH